MEGLNLSLDAGWGAGLVLATTRVGAFAVASPVLRFLPATARVALVLALGMFLASPVDGSVTLPALLTLGVANAGIGATLGYLTGVIFHIFAVAGGLADITSGLAVASVFDPTRGEQSSVFSRMFNLTAIALFTVSGGLELLVGGLHLSVEAVSLAEPAAPSVGVADLATGLVSGLVVAGAELAFPVLAALFLTEVVLGLASRFAPQANVFLLGLPAKIFIALSVASVALLLFPEAMGGVQLIMRDTFVDALRAF